MSIKECWTKVKLRKWIETECVFNKMSTLVIVRWYINRFCFDSFLCYDLGLLLFSSRFFLFLFTDLDWHWAFFFLSFVFFFYFFFSCGFVLCSMLDTLQWPITETRNIKPNTPEFDWECRFLDWMWPPFYRIACVAQRQSAETKAGDQERENDNESICTDIDVYWVAFSNETVLCHFCNQQQSKKGRTEREKEEEKTRAHNNTKRKKSTNRAKSTPCFTSPIYSKSRAVAQHVITLYVCSVHIDYLSLWITRIFILKTTLIDVFQLYTIIDYSVFFLLLLLPLVLRALLLLLLLLVQQQQLHWPRVPCSPCLFASYPRQCDTSAWVQL